MESHTRPFIRNSARTQIGTDINLSSLAYWFWAEWTQLSAAPLQHLSLSACTHTTGAMSAWLLHNYCSAKTSFWFTSIKTKRSNSIFSMFCAFVKSCKIQPIVSLRRRLRDLVSSPTSSNHLKTDRQLERFSSNLSEEWSWHLLLSPSTSAFLPTSAQWRHVPRHLTSSV